MLLIKGHLAAVVVALILLSGNAVSGEGIECEILQYKLERFYFGAGEEQDIYPGCRFVILKEADTVHSGQIEFSYQGVSLSRPAADFSDTLAIAELGAFIEPAAVDSTSRIKLGCYGVPWWSLVRLEFAYTRVYLDSVSYYFDLSITTRGNPVVGDLPKTMQSDYETDKFDGFFSASMPPQNTSQHAQVISSPAPFVAVIVPNLSEKMNEQGFVTTSLYYRFDVGRLWPAFFQGEPPSPVNRLYPTDTGSERAYPYDPEKGQTLLNKYRHRPKKVGIGFRSPGLEEVADYFADVLSRDKIKVEVKSELKDRDILLNFIPADLDNPAAGLRHVYRILLNTKPEEESLKETLEILNNQIAGAEKAEDTAAMMHYCRLADRTLQSELGVFPLFRPTIYFVAGKNLRNARFDESGYLDIASLKKIILPEPDWEDRP
ncbi:MAG: hypothetical protein JSU74_11395 [Candidatus Zixiibacteriota bacterium]|nr:MAG: hypothetical protein JSU74_11395 [candidate division Zixibacteria bacterium]